MLLGILQELELGGNSVFTVCFGASHDSIHFYLSARQESEILEEILWVQ